MTDRLVRFLRGILSGPPGTTGPPYDPAFLAGAAAMLGHHTFRNEPPPPCRSPGRHF